MSTLPKMRLGERLVQEGALTPEQVAAALETQRETGKRLGEILAETGDVPDVVLVRTLAATLGLPGCVLRHGLMDPRLLTDLGKAEALRFKCIPMFRVKDTMTIAMAEPQSLPAIDRLRQITGCRIRPVLALEPNIREFIEKYSEGAVNIDSFLTSITDSDVEVIEDEAVDEGGLNDLSNLVAGSPIVNLVNLAILTGIKDKASDIHIEPDKAGSRIRYRIDGGLRDLMQPPRGMHASIVSRVKVIAKMDIAEKRMPQEGRVRLVAEKRDIDLRVSSIPTLLGEKLVIRILDKSNLCVRMEDLGFHGGSLEQFKRILSRPHGIMLVTGPTGSGKTTTLYSALDLLRSPDRNIVTVEDPVEYQLDLINQIQVQEAIGLNFARVLRSVLRQDPDIIMVGEIRDEETARVAVQASLTGHLVLATLHTNDAPGAVARMLDMNVESYLLSSALIGVVAQRLVRTVCQSCETKYFPTELVLRDAGLDDLVGHSFRKGTGCKQCHHTGFRGRLGVYEIMEVTGIIRRLIHEAVPVHVLREETRRQGSRTLREEGVQLALKGQTSLEEVMRVTFHDEEQPGAESTSKSAPPAIDAEREAA